MRPPSFLLFVFLWPVAVAAQDPLEFDSATAEAYRDDWGLVLTPYAFLAAQSTDVGGTALRQSFNDLASITNLGFQALFALSRRFVISAGYRQFKYSRTEGEGDGAVETTVGLVGPAVELSIGIF
jgi:hypothetical protein